MVDLAHCLADLLVFDIPLLHYINLKSSIICCVFSGDIYLSFGFGIFLFLFHLQIFLNYFCGVHYDAFVILSAITLSPIKLPITSADFLNAFFKAVLTAG